jgi:DHA2 family multidrug resistance protein
MLFLVMGLGCFQVMLEQGQSDDWFQSDFIVWMAVLAVVGMASFIYWELTYPEPAVDLRVLKDRALAAGTAFGTVMGFGLFGGIFILPIFLQDIRGYSAMQSGLIMLPGAIASAFMLPVSGRLMGKFPARSILFVSVLTFSFANFLLRRLTIDTGPGDMFWPLVIRGAALGLINVPLSLVSLSHLRGRNLPYGTALFNLMRQLGGSTGIAYLSSRVSAEIFVHRSALVAHVVASNNLTIGRLQLLTGAMVAQGMPLAVAKKQALAITDMTISQQASVMSYGSAFVFMAVTFLFLLPLLFLFHSDLHHEHRPVAHAAAE